MRPHSTASAAAASRITTGFSLARTDIMRGLAHAGGAVGREDQADRMRAFARRDRRWVASAARFERFAHGARVAGFPVRRLRDRLVATGCQDLQAARHLAQQQALARDLLLAV